MLRKRLANTGAVRPEVATTKATGKSSTVGKPLAPVLTGLGSRKPTAAMQAHSRGGQEEEEGRDDIDLNAYTQGQGIAGVLNDDAFSRGRSNRRNSSPRRRPRRDRRNAQVSSKCD
jgi:hypothetical protein